MVQKSKTTCSPYLLMKRRSLRDACRQIAESHGRPMVPCGACDLADLCPADLDRSKPSDDVGVVLRRRDSAEILANCA